MNINDYEKAKNHLLTTFNSLAPSGKEQQLVNALHEMEKDRANGINVSHNAILQMLTGAILDVLKEMP